MSKVSIIIPTWNGRKLLKNCLESLQKQTFKDFDILVVDNGSSDGTVEFVENDYPNIKLIIFKKNTGFAFAVNAGIKASKADYLILVNNDTKLDKRCVEYLVKAAEAQIQVGMVAAKMLNYHNPKLIDSVGDYIDEVGHANNIGLGENDGPKFDKPDEVFLVTGGGSLFKRQVFDRIGFFDEDYFAYMEDVDLCFRAQLKGFKGWYEPKAVIYHIHKATSSKNKPFLEYLQFRNMMQTIIKDFPMQHFLKNFNLVKIILVNINTVLYLTINGFFWSAIKAEVYIFLNFFKLLRKRKQIQSDIEVPIDYILENIRPKKLTFF